MNKFGVHGLVWSGSWGAQECAYTVESSKEAGFDLVEFPVFSPDQMEHVLKVHRGEGGPFR